MADERLIVQPGGTAASLVALDPGTGDLIWETPGGKAPYASLIVASLGGRRQIVGCDAVSFCGWDLKNGARLWTLRPEVPGGFHVPSPFVIRGGLILAGEREGARLYEFTAGGIPSAHPVARQQELAPDAQTPVPVGTHIVGLGADGALLCLDAGTLKVRGRIEDPDLGVYASCISDNRSRVLTLSETGVLFLHRIEGPSFKELGRLRVAGKGDHLLSHPALVKDRLFLRIGKRVVALDLR